MSAAKSRQDRGHPLIFDCPRFLFLRLFFSFLEDRAILFLIKITGLHELTVSHERAVMKNICFVKSKGGKPGFFMEGPCVNARDSMFVKIGGLGHCDDSAFD
jgi:hypothetical protein